MTRTARKARIPADFGFKAPFSQNAINLAADVAEASLYNAAIDATLASMGRDLIALQSNANNIESQVVQLDAMKMELVKTIDSLSDATDAKSSYCSKVTELESQINSHNNDVSEYNTHAGYTKLKDHSPASAVEPLGEAYTQLNSEILCSE